MEALQFSGGMDSLACLELLKDLPGLVVVTASTDGAYPERSDYLDKVAKHYRHIKFYSIYADREIAEHGHPVDVVPLKYTAAGALFRAGPLKYQPYYECCKRGLWEPMQSFMEQIGAKTIYRGQRNSDALKAPIHDGFVADGVTYRLPIEHWTRQQVKDYVLKYVPDLVPEYYGKEQTSRDCWDCTAYLHENVERIRNLPTEQRVKVSVVLDEWRRDVNEETRW